jgi:hypothetical protein
MSEEPDLTTAVSLRVIPERFGRVPSGLASGLGEIPYEPHAVKMPPANPRTARVLPRRRQSGRARSRSKCSSVTLLAASPPQMNDQRAQGHQDKTGELPLIERVAAQMPVERVMIE